MNLYQKIFESRKSRELASKILEFYPDENLDELDRRLEEFSPLIQKWITKMATGEGVAGHGLEEVFSYAKDFLKHQRRLPKEGRDINQYQSVGELLDALEELGKSNRSQKRESRKDSVYLGTFGDYELILPLTQDASCELGSRYGKVGTKWCTAAEVSRNMFNYYTAQFNLFYLIDPNSRDMKWGKLAFGLYRNLNWVESSAIPVDAEGKMITLEDFRRLVSNWEGALAAAKNYATKNPMVQWERFIDSSSESLRKLEDIDGDLNLGGFQNLEFTKLRSVGGNLSLLYSQIREFPQLKRVGGYLNLRNSQTRELPQLKSVGLSLYLENSQISELPQLESVGGDLDLKDSQIEELPQLERVGSYLNLRKSQIRELPQLESVGGDLDLRNSRIRELPQLERVELEIFVNEEDLHYWRSYFAQTNRPHLAQKVVAF